MTRVDAVLQDRSIVMYEIRDSETGGTCPAGDLAGSALLSEDHGPRTTTKLLGGGSTLLSLSASGL